MEELGLQVPAGTIEAGEEPADAALREAREETGLDGLVLTAALGTAEYDITPHRPEVQERHFFALGTTVPTPERWFSEETDAYYGGGPIRLECLWIPVSQGHIVQSGQGALLHRLYPIDS